MLSDEHLDNLLIYDHKYAGKYIQMVWVWVQEGVGKCSKIGKGIMGKVDQKEMVECENECYVVVMWLMISEGDTGDLSVSGSWGLEVRREEKQIFTCL